MLRVVGVHGERKVVRSGHVAPLCASLRSDPNRRGEKDSPTRSPCLGETRVSSFFSAHPTQKKQITREKPLKFQVHCKTINNTSWIGFCRGPLDEMDYFKGSVCPDDSFGLFMDHGMWHVNMDPGGSGDGLMCIELAVT